MVNARGQNWTGGAEALAGVSVLCAYCRIQIGEQKLLPTCYLHVPRKDI